jgi:hypothetical protein
MPVVVPRDASLGEPTSVWFAARGGGQTSLVYARDGVLVQEFAGNSAMAVEKYVDAATGTQAVTIDGHDAVFLHGGEHVVWYDDAGGDQVTEVGRLAGNALVMQRGPLTIRIEADLDLDDLVAIARALR